VAENCACCIPKLGGIKSEQNYGGASEVGEGSYAVPGAYWVRGGEKAAKKKKNGTQLLCARTNTARGEEHGGFPVWTGDRYPKNKEGSKDPAGQLSSES